MKLEKIREEYHFYTGKVSDLARQLAFAGIAIVWIFKVDRGGSPKLPMSLLSPTMALVLTLLCDFLQYVYGAIAYWARYATAERRKKLNKEPDDATYKVSIKWILRPMDVFFVLKIVGVIVSYVLLAAYVLEQVTY